VRQALGHARYRAAHRAVAQHLHGREHLGVQGFALARFGARARLGGGQEGLDLLEGQRAGGRFLGRDREGLSVISERFGVAAFVGLGAGQTHQRLRRGPCRAENPRALGDGPGEQAFGAAEIAAQGEHAAQLRPSLRPPPGGQAGRLFDDAPRLDRERLGPAQIAGALRHGRGEHQRVRELALHEHGRAENRRGRAARFERGGNAAAQLFDQRAAALDRVARDGQRARIVAPIGSMQAEIGEIARVLARIGRPQDQRLGAAESRVGFLHALLVGDLEAELGERGAQARMFGAEGARLQIERLAVGALRPGVIADGVLHARELDEIQVAPGGGAARQRFRTQAAGQLGQQGAPVGRGVGVRTGRARQRFGQSGGGAGSAVAEGEPPGGDEGHGEPRPAAVLQRARRQPRLARLGQAQSFGRAAIGARGQGAVGRGFRDRFGAARAARIDVGIHRAHGARRSAAQHVPHRRVGAGTRAAQNGPAGLFGARQAQRRPFLRGRARGLAAREQGERQDGRRRADQVLTNSGGKRRRV
jgi:hypothetical protein